MTATKSDIERWLIEGKEKGATHVVVVHDHWDHDNFPLYIMPGQDAREEFNRKYPPPRPGEAAYSADECYNLSLNLERQLHVPRAQYWD